MLGDAGLRVVGVGADDEQRVARADDLRCFAVTTGRYGAEQLTGADAVAGDAAALRELLQAALAG